LHTQYVHRLEAELWECWHARQSRQVWVLARRIAGTSVGPGKRYFNVPLRARLSAQEWDEFLSKPAHEGGLTSTPVTLTGIAASRQPLSTAPQLEHVAAAAEDYHHITSLAVHRLAFRKSSPPWSLTQPSYSNMPQQCGSGFRIFGRNRCRRPCR